jgi:UDP-N-acetylmuramate--alanine ligase
MAVVTSIDAEHLDYYGSLKNVREAFLKFANKVPFYGSAIVGIDDPQVRRILPNIKRRMRTYATTISADLTASEIEFSHLTSHFQLFYRGKALGAFQVRGAGQHDVQNAMAAVLMGLELEIPVDLIRRGLLSFSGVDRRFQIRGTNCNVTVVDDYGHHPTEIRATLAAARNCNFKKLHVIFQPHRHSRTASLFQELATCFKDCDHLCVVDTYGAGEDPIKGVNAMQLTEKIRASGHLRAYYYSSVEAACAAVVKTTESGDAVITLGAGNIWQAGEKLLALLAKNQNNHETCGQNNS